MPNNAAPETVACPCGNGYAERRQVPIRELVRRAGTAERKLRLTFTYKHEGCPVGGHIVTVAGTVDREAGPLFADEPPLLDFMARVAQRPELAADGGEPL